MNSVPKLEMRKVSKWYPTDAGEVWALDEVDLEVADGEIVCIVGPSGCGKSTLLNLVAGFEPPDSGEILIDGQAPAPPGPDRLIMFQEGALFPWLRVIDNVAFGLKMAGLTKQERRPLAMKQLEKVGLARFARSRLHELSVGMRQRVALARALIMEPRLLLMDEPFAALDAQTRDDLYAELQGLWASSKCTIIFVTHNVREAACLGDRVLIMSHRPGRLVAKRRVDAPRPRTIEDESVISTARLLRADLAAATAGGEDGPAAAKKEAVA